MATACFPLYPCHSKSFLRVFRLLFVRSPNLSSPFPPMTFKASTRLCIAVFFLAIGSSQSQVDLAASWAYPTADKGAEAGFAGKIVQARKNAGLTATSARGNAHLNGTLFDGDTEMPYPNLVIDSANPAATDGNWIGTTPVDAGGGFTLSGPINFSSDGAGLTREDGNFSDFDVGLAGSFFPGASGRQR